MDHWDPVFVKWKLGKIQLKPPPKIQTDAPQQSHSPFLVSYFRVNVVFFSNISPWTFWDIWDRSFAAPAYAWTCPYSGYRQSSPGETDSLVSSDVVHVEKWHMSRIFNEKTVGPPILIRKNVFSSTWDGQNPWESYVLDLLGWCCPYAMLSGNYGNDGSSIDAKGSQQQFIWIDEKPKKNIFWKLNPSHHPTYCFF